ncbi:MalY/PatB family protein [Hyalangium rubrum]|uniref:cysteine-S-conjugate beta-lyase n=1 Tax=Hyalangium rubrum TaxID=3103134 RepID=A0ABU5HFJ9_9BACT|nr:PatB family C-S lyase [Hyalangium sp. s54d21]MDY7232136.1 PatB family C-S lyase [Hyalangium sp. s54d21]
MDYGFDQLLERERSDSLKWRKYGRDVLPMWVADMDFRSPEPVIQALRARVEQGVLGYPFEPLPELIESVTRYLLKHHGWQVAPEAIVLLPGLIPAFNVACRAFAQPGDGVLLQVPTYPPLLQCSKNAGLSRDEAFLTRDASGAYEIDWDSFEKAIHPRSRVLLLSNPHNPLGRVFRREELTRIAEHCLRNELTIVSDEIHCDLVFRGHRHTCIAMLSPEVEARTITLMSPSKAFNLAGLKMAFAVIPNAALRQKFLAARADMLPSPNLFGCVAMQAAYNEGEPWLRALVEYLEANRDFLVDFVRRSLPGVQMTAPEGTYLAWMDCRGAGIPGNPTAFFLEHARVALSPGESFGRGGEGFVRLNFGCPRALLSEGLERMRQALERRR